jgi:competence ComEA-like helix-hairpin-helix protein
MKSRFLARVVLGSFVLCAAILPALGTTKKPPPQPVNLNTASSEQLQLVPGIGPATAEKILQMRKSYGPFKSVDDLRAVRGIGPKRIEKMRKYLTVGKGVAPKPTAAVNANAAKPKLPAAKTTEAKPLPAKPDTNSSEDEEPQ